jgi:hypothetical protein
MKEIYYFACENIVIISSKALQLYPKIEQYVFTRIKPYKTLLFFYMKEKNVKKEKFNETIPIGFGNVLPTRKHANVMPILGDAHVKYHLLKAIMNVFTLPIVLELDTHSKDLLQEVRVYNSLGFGDPILENGDRIITLRKTATPTPEKKLLKQVMAISQIQTFECKTHFPKHVADLLSSYIVKDVEVGGQIKIDEYIKDPNGGSDIAVLGFDPETLIHGSEETFTVAMPYSTYQGFSFHTHPDAALRSERLFFACPSVADITAVTDLFLKNYNILAHFVASPEGIWVIHIKPRFQRILYELKNNNLSKKCQEQLLVFIERPFLDIQEKQRTERTVPNERLRAREKFEYVSKHLKISDFVGTDLEKDCSKFINFNDHTTMYDIDLIKWDVFEKTKVILTFTYILDPVGGFHARVENEMVDEMVGVDEMSDDDEMSDVEMVDVDEMEVE